MKSASNVRDGIPSRFVAKIETGDWKRRLIWWAFRRWVLNEDYFAVTTRFTGPRPRGSNQVSTTKANATAYRIYIDRRDSVGKAELLQRRRTQERYFRETQKAQEYIRSLQVVA